MFETRFPATLTLLAALLFSIPLAVPAQSPSVSATADTPEPTPAGTPQREATLANLLASIERAEGEVRELQTRMARAEPLEAERIAAELEGRQSELARLRRSFETVATSIELDEFERDDSPPLDWSSELKELLGPMINELKRVTTRPRELDRIGRQIEELGEKLETAERAIANLDETADGASDDLKERLATTKERWVATRDGLTTELQLAKERRERLQGQRTSVLETLESLTQVFFRSRGRNLLFAILAFAAAWALVRGLHLGLQRFSPMHRGTRHIATRVVDLLFIIGATLAGLTAAVAVLYIVGDWVLLTIVSLFLVGLAWASRTALPRIWRQLMILMNLGGVRETERLVYDGIPYRVERLGFYTYVRNPALAGGLLRLPLTHIDELYTRPYESDERWFPTSEGDWVLLGDGTHAKVVKQSPEMVTLVAMGGARMLVPARDFIAQSPTVLAAGFRIAATFGIDYQHQATITGEIPATIHAFVRAGVERAGMEPLLHNLTVEFEAAGASSLDIAVLADFKGKAGPDYQRLTRLIQRLCVDACNENHWVIPFSQVTVHMATPLEVRGKTTEPA